MVKQKQNLTLAIDKDVLNQVRTKFPKINLSKFMQIQMRSLLLNEEYYLELHEN